MRKSVGQSLPVLPKHILIKEKFDMEEMKLRK